MEGSVYLQAIILWPLTNYIGDSVVAVRVLNGLYEIIAHRLQNFCSLSLVSMINNLLHDTKAIFLTTKFIYFLLYLVEDKVLKVLLVFKTFFLVELLDYMGTLLVL